MTDYELGYEHGFNDRKYSAGIKKYPLNTNYCEGYSDGNNRRIYEPVYEEPNYLGSNEMFDGYL